MHDDVSRSQDFVGASKAERPGSLDDVMKRSMARAAIICSLEAQYVAMVAADRDPKVMWRKLAESHKSKCTAAVHSLRSRSFTLKMSGEDKMRSFVSQICSIKS